jgi:hypothetical protein
LMMMMISTRWPPSTSSMSAHRRTRDAVGRDEVVADALEVVHEVRGEHHRDVTFDGHIGEGGYGWS